MLLKVIILMRNEEEVVYGQFCEQGIAYWNTILQNNSTEANNNREREMSHTPDVPAYCTNDCKPII